MRILFLGCLYSQEKKDLFRRASKRGYQYAAQNFQESLLKGLYENGIDTTVITIPSLSTWPMGNSMPYIPSHPFKHSLANNECVNDVIEGISQGFVNIVGLNNVPYRKLRKFIRKWIDSSDEQSYILVYGLHINLMKIALTAKQEFKMLRIGIVIPDLPMYMGYNKYLKLIGCQERDIAKVNSMVPEFDAFFPLTKDMMSLLPLNLDKIKCCVIEGLFSGVFPKVEKDKNKVVLYTGGISERYGIIDLLKAFEMLQDSDYRLWLCGTGDAVEAVEAAMAKDDRICYYGTVSHERALQLQKQALLLVNPRHSSEEFTKFSFPSKTLEYLASGTAVLMSHLGSIPSEYDDFLFYFDDESPVGMSRKIQEICSMDREELTIRGQKSSDFIFAQKNPKVQVGKIVGLLQSI